MHHRRWHIGGYYISASVRIMLSYDAESGVLYLSPGGDYVLTE